jgi:hypothetical protein
MLFRFGDLPRQIANLPMNMPLLISMNGAQLVELADFGIDLDFLNLPQKGIYNTADLIARAELALGDSLAVIDDGTQKDFSQPGPCLAFDLPTAAAFHFTRAVESVLRKSPLVSLQGISNGRKTSRNGYLYK